MNLIFKQIKIATKFRNHKLIYASRMNSTYLVNQPKYSFLKELGLEEKNNGVFHSHERWSGNGNVDV